MYPEHVLRRIFKDRSPTAGLLLSLLVSLCAVLAYSVYVRSQIANLRQVQSQLVDRNRRDSLQLLRIQNDLNGVGLAIRDMQEGDEPYPVSAWQPQFQRLRTDLEDALHLEDQLATASRTPEERKYLSNSFARFWSQVDSMFALAASGQTQALAATRSALQTNQGSLSNAVARLLVENNRSEEEAAARIEAVYAGVERQMYIFLGGTLLAIIVTGILIIYYNRRLFSQLAMLSEQRRELAQRLITTEEAIFQAISRELHDEFGQVLTAMGSLLGRVGRQAPEGSPWLRDLNEVREIAQSTLESVRSLSQTLHPAILGEAGVESAIDWYISNFRRQNAVEVEYVKSGISRPVKQEAGIHIYRILQEALNNVVRHSHSQRATVRLSFQSKSLLLEVQDRGTGLQPEEGKRGLGLVAMRERAELLGAKIEWLSIPEGGTMVRLEIPQEQLS